MKQTDHREDQKTQLGSWRIVARYRQWIGKPDPSNLGEFFVYSNDPSWLHEHANKLTLGGHKVYRIEKVMGIA